eukprot:2478644-Pyramimonas_sp.AAC.1
MALNGALRQHHPRAESVWLVPPHLFKYQMEELRMEELPQSIPRSTLLQAIHAKPAPVNPSRPG